MYVKNTDDRNNRMTKGTRKFSTAMSALLLAVSSNAALANAANNTFQIWLSHDLNGIIALIDRLVKEYS